ncbi:G-patch domain and KOW motifs-containing protein homolog 1-like [Homalodisca vitripennis]|nr:G-patch domain and KOW motifs-containing protein homolog 1-like [Homalodisca vitripennis]
MGDEIKKISFGFSKLSKKPSIISSHTNQVKPEKNTIELIDCVEGNSIKLKEPFKSENNVLVIPLKKQSEDLRVRQDKELETKQVGGGTAVLVGDFVDNQVSNNSSQVCEPSTDSQASDVNKDLKISNPQECEKLTLDEIAAREIIAELNSNNANEEARIFSVPLTSNPPTGEKESSLDDYDNVPVNEFGMAMLRGMGWAPGKGIGKNEKSVTVKLPTVRPKGMGLGADKFIKEASNNKNVDENLKMIKGSFVRVVAGPHKDCYGQIEGFDDESGRLIVKLVLKNVSVSLNEFMVLLVDKKEFLKNSKVINVAKYEQYKDDESKKNPDQEQIDKSVDKPTRTDSKLKYEKSVNHSKSKKHGYKQQSSSLESEDSDREITKAPISSKTFSHKSSNKQSKRSRSNSRSEDDNYSRKRRDRSVSLDKNSYSKERGKINKTTDAKNSRRPAERSLNRRKYSSESSRTSSSSDYSSSRNRTKTKVYKKPLRTRSSSSDRSVSSGCYSKKDKNRTKKKKPSSHKYKSRSRSRSPRKKNSHKKHKKR